MSEIEGTKCIRKRLVFDDEHYYLIVGEKFLEIVTPHENRPENMKNRLLLNELCKTATKLLKELNGDK